MLIRLILVKRLEAVWKLFGFAHLIERGAGKLQAR